VRGPASHPRASRPRAFRPHASRGSASRAARAPLGAAAPPPREAWVSRESRGEAVSVRCGGDTGVPITVQSPPTIITRCGAYACRAVCAQPAASWRLSPFPPPAQSFPNSITRASATLRRLDLCLNQARSGAYCCNCCPVQASLPGVSPGPRVCVSRRRLRERSCASRADELPVAGSMQALGADAVGVGRKPTLVPPARNLSGLSLSLQEMGGARPTAEVLVLAPR